MTRPVGISSIAIEATYDSSQKVIPADILWTELQRAFAARGKMILTTPDQADALIRAHIKSADSTPMGISVPTREGITKDPKGDDIFRSNPSTKFRNLLLAGRWTDKQELRFNVSIEMIQLRSGKILFSKSYKGGAQFQSFTSEQEASISSHFLRFEENRLVKFRAISRSISEQAVSDILL